MRRPHTQILIGTFLVLIAFGAPGAAFAGDEECKPTQAANDLRACGYCREVKQILSDPEFEGVSFDVTALRLGATVHMEAKTPEAELLLQEFTECMWGAEKLDSHGQVCDYCKKRRVQLDNVIVDWSATEDGIQLVLISEKPKFAQWALHDARETQSWVLSSAGN